MTNLEAVAYEQIRSWLVDRCAISYPENKGDLLRQRLSRVQAKHKIPTLEELAKALYSMCGADLEQDVMHAASTNHTYFYREREVLDAFVKNILPNVSITSELRIWSAACSTGNEAYTIAMLIAEEKGTGWLPTLRILGTDISGPSLETAERAIYPERELEHVPASVRAAYFRHLGPDKNEVIPEIKRTCIFRRMNLKTTPYPFQKKFQVVFCRNLFYYFDRADQISTLNAIYNVTEPGGFLVTSVTESVRDLGTSWIPVQTGIYKRGR